MEDSIRQVTFRVALSALGDLLLPRECVTCGRTLGPDESDICSDCLEDIPRTYYWLRSRNPMADTLNSLIGEGEGFRPYVYAVSLFFYNRDSRYSSITKAIKYSRNIGVGRKFATMLGEAIAVAGHFSDVDMVVPVPLHWTRRFKRGYNQAEVIARGIADVLRAPVCTEILRRKHRTGTQTHLGKEGKAANVRGAFVVGRHNGQIPHHILLVDDVFTTGSTLAECYRTLSASFGPGVCISAATLGYVP